MEDKENLTLDQIMELPQEEQQAKLIEYAKAQEEARKKHEADTDRGIKKVIDEKKYLELVASEAKLLLKDKNYFTELLDKDEWLAKAVLNEFFDGISIEDALAQIDDKSKEEYTKKKEITNIEDTVKELFTKKEVDSKVKKFVADINLSTEDRVLFDKEFAELTNGRKLDETNIEKYLRLAFKEALPNVDYKSIEDDAKSMAQSKGWFTQTKQQTHNARKDNIAYLKSQWFF